jgi:hypothetical protein
VIDLVKKLSGYEVKYGKAWKANQATFKMLYSDLKEAYNRLLRAMAASNLDMYHVVEPFRSMTTIFNDATDIIGRAFWAFKQCIRICKHC